MAPLGDEYVRILRRGAHEERWVDIYPNQGKRMGAFSSGVMDTRPFIFMSYNDDIYSMSTLAHELGHSMHSYYARHTQPFIYSNYGLFQAEVASNMHQALTRRHLLATRTDPAFQIAVIEEAMSNFYRYFFIMPSLARLELEVHERVERGGAITADYLNNLMADLMLEVYGSEVEVGPRDRVRIGSTWAQFHTHLYSNFYVYQYATGIAAADHLVGRVAEGDPKAVESYLAFLKSAGSMYPMDGLRMAGVDMTSQGAGRGRVRDTGVDGRPAGEADRRLAEIDPEDVGVADLEAHPLVKAVGGGPRRALPRLQLHHLRPGSPPDLEAGR